MCLYWCVAARGRGRSFSGGRGGGGGRGGDGGRGGGDRGGFQKRY